MSQSARTALVTGASSGIGAALANEIAADGFDVVLTARREERLRRLGEKLESAYGISATVLPKDLSEPSAPTELHEQVESEGIEIHTLVNNAGVPLHGRIDRQDTDEILNMVQVNVTSLTHLTRLFTPSMVDRGEGGVLNTASLIAFYPTPEEAVYSATKAYVLSFSEAIAHELAAEGLTVTVLCPGAVETEFMEMGGVEETGIDEGIINTPDAVAAAGWSGYKSGKRIVLPARSDKVFAQFPRLLPRKLVPTLAKESWEDGVSYIP